jgi:predicted ATPase
MDEAAAKTEIGLGRSPERRLIGRRPELRRILSALETTASGRGRLVLLSGEPGIGKTRLAQEALARVHSECNSLNGCTELRHL